MARTYAYIVLGALLLLGVANAKPQECDRLTPSAVCEANGVGIFCNPCNGQSYIVCAAYQAAQVEYCADGKPRGSRSLALQVHGAGYEGYVCPLNEGQIHAFMCAHTARAKYLG